MENKPAAKLPILSVVVIAFVGLCTVLFLIAWIIQANKKEEPAAATILPIVGQSTGSALGVSASVDDDYAITAKKVEGVSGSTSRFEVTIKNTGTSRIEFSPGLQLFAKDASGALYEFSATQGATLLGGPLLPGAVQTGTADFETNVSIVTELMFRPRPGAEARPIAIITE